MAEGLCGGLFVSVVLKGRLLVEGGCEGIPFLVLFVMELAHFVGMGVVCWEGEKGEGDEVFETVVRDLQPISKKARETTPRATAPGPAYAIH